MKQSLARNCQQKSATDYQGRTVSDTMCQVCEQILRKNIDLSYFQLVRAIRQ
jgi:hypothetical protein